MVVVSIAGGLGNQMFQYALGRALALARGVPLKIDITWFDNSRIRRFELDAFNVAVELVGRSGMSDLKEEWRRGSPICQMTEKRFNFDPSVLTNPAQDLHVVGYWQSEKYFSSIAPILRRELTLRKSPAQSTRRLAELIGGRSSAAVHLRRGDYDPNDQSNALHRFLGLSYYARAVEIVRRRHPGCALFIFSDDPLWVQSNFRPAPPFEYVDPSTERSAPEALYLMSLRLRQPHVQLVGAWLNRNPDKLVVAPARWLGNDSVNTDDVIPEAWRQL